MPEGGGGCIITAPSMRFRGGINVSLARRLVRKSSLIAQKAINTRNFDSGSGHQLSFQSHSKLSNLIYEDPFAVFLLILLFLLGLERAGQQATCNVERTRPNTLFIDCAFVADWGRLTL